MKKTLVLVISIFLCNFAFAQTPEPTYTSSPFEQIDELLPTPNVYRTGSGAPGHAYWQQKADYQIKVELDDKNQRLTGSENITYYNYSPDPLEYLWVQLDQNRFKKDSDSYTGAAATLSGTKLQSNEDFYSLYTFLSWVKGKTQPEDKEGGYKITAVKDEYGNDLSYTINNTMMRINLAEPLAANGGTFKLQIDWNHNIVDADKMGARGGYEYFPEDENYLYEIAQWFPRMAVYDDFNGWQNKQFLGRGEFALPFGDYEVEITAPADHIVGATGVLQNSDEVLTSEQISRLQEAETASAPVLIVTQDEAEKAEKGNEKSTKTWRFKAENVRDFAWASSRKFIWDAMKVDIAGSSVWAMSYYPKEGNPLWGQYSTQVVAHTLRVYSRYTIDYPYPVAISVHGPVFGMEYPMICFNGGRPEADGTVPASTRNAMVGVIIHEVGHNFFPMIVNSDERQWTWMDEGLNSFCEYLAEVELPTQDWARGDYTEETPYPSRRGPAKNIVDYMKGDPNTLVPIMTNSEQINIFQFGNNAYGKPATALNILRETVMGRELFDYAFKKYSERWAFKHPMPADFFRTMEDASGVDLDWFWRGWFYGTNPVEIALDNVTLYRIDGERPADSPFEFKSVQSTAMNAVFDQFEVAEADRPAILDENIYYYTLDFKNNGGLVMPLIIQMDYEDGESDILRVPAEIWRLNSKEVSKIIMTEKPVKAFILDPKEETADIDVSNNAMPRGTTPSKFEEFKKNKDN